MEEVSTIGLDLAKSVFQVHGIDAAGRVVVRRQLRRGEVLGFFARLRPCLVGMEACATAHHWGRELTRLGHTVKLMPPAYVKPYVKRGKTDAADAEAIAEAVTRPTMRFVAVKSMDQQAVLMLHKVRDLLVRQRTMLINAVRGHAAEFGVIAAKGRGKVAELLQRAHAEDVPALALALLKVLAGQIDALEAKLKALEAELMALHKADPVSQCLATQPGIGPIGAVSFSLKVPDPKAFGSGRHFAAWLGITPKENSSGGRHRQGRISRQGDEGLRRLLVLGATAVIRFAKPGRASPWLINLLARRPRKVAAVALANKMARILWAMMVSGEVYRRPLAA